MRRTEIYSRYIMNLKRKLVEIDKMINISKDELQTPREQVRSADPLYSCLISPPSFTEISFSTSLAKMALNPNFGALVYNELDVSPSKEAIYLYSEESSKHGI